MEETTVGLPNHFAGITVMKARKKRQTSAHRSWALTNAQLFVTIRGKKTLARCRMFELRNQMCDLWL